MPTLTKIAWTGETLVGFAPYVPAIGDDGSVVFQAERADGSHAIMIGRSDGLETVCTTGSEFTRFVSHPDVDASGAIVWYAVDSAGKTALIKADRGSITSIHTEGAHLGVIGPLGPTAEDGAVAFRANLPNGTPAIFLSRAGSRTLVAKAEGDTVGFHGLPVVAGGAVLYRADLADGGSAIELWTEGHVERVASTGSRWADLGRFPTITPGGIVAFAANLADGRPWLSAGKPGSIVAIPLESARFESLRGILMTDGGQVWFYGTPRDGTLGIYCGIDADKPVLSIGRQFDGSPVVEFALNPVSVNNNGQIAVRLTLDDGRQAIVRVDP